MSKFARNKRIANRNQQIKKYATRGWSQQRIADKIGLSQPMVSVVINNPNSHQVAPNYMPKVGRPKNR